MHHLGYALWLVPSEPECRALQRLMNFRPHQYSSRTHSSRSYPRFNPHITLATFTSPPNFPLAKLLPLNIKAPPVYFESIKVGSNYLGSVSVEISKSRELMDLHDITMAHLKKAHKINARSYSFPHMSLFYLDEAVKGERLRVAEILRTSGRVVEHKGVKGVALNCTLDGAAPEFHAMTGFVGSEIWLVDCTGAVAGWKVLEKQKVFGKQNVLQKKPAQSSPPISHGSNPGRSVSFAPSVQSRGPVLPIALKNHSPFQSQEAHTSLLTRLILKCRWCTCGKNREMGMGYH